MRLNPRYLVDLTSGYSDVVTSSRTGYSTTQPRTLPPVFKSTQPTYHPPTTSLPTSPPYFPTPSPTISVPSPHLRPLFFHSSQHSGRAPTGSCILRFDASIIIGVLVNKPRAQDRGPTPPHVALGGTTKPPGPVTRRQWLPVAASPLTAIAGDTNPRVATSRTDAPVTGDNRAASSRTAETTGREKAPTVGKPGPPNTVGLFSTAVLRGKSPFARPGGLGPPERASTFSRCKSKQSTPPTPPFEPDAVPRACVPRAYN